ncbi:Gfo/Idh/MocA family protein [Ferruginibacter sp. SUN106]|uniref:Gfo/Idh/MocA family protein n=1 Tax=Ferruginibacter sp. SUN106 TaxID=2978348 RepID=UPI003D3642BD
MDKIRWGILSTAKIGREKVIPAMQAGSYCRIDAIASRDIQLAQATADALGIPKAYNSYEALLNDADIDAVYIPLPNHLHVPWAIKALEANKHVLCEKPIALSPEEAKALQLAAQQQPHLKLMEAFMYRLHPQWIKAKQIVKDGAIGELKNIQSFFSYYNTDTNNIRNKKEAGGGGLMDIGCYCVSLARFIFNEEPTAVFGNVEFDPVMQTDRMASGILKFSKGDSTFTCSTQLMPYQRVNISGTTGRIEIEIPFNAPPLTATRIGLHTKTGTEEILFEAVDQYTLQGDAFSKAILENTAVPTDLQDAVNNMVVIDAVFKSSAEGKWVMI